MNDRISDIARLDAEVWFSIYGRIKTKEGKLITAPKPNVLQRRMFAHYRRCRQLRKACLMMVLKPRQVGASTATQAISYHHQRSFENLNGALMGDITGTSDKVFEIFRTYAKGDALDWPKKDRDQLDGTDDIVLGNGSHYGKETAGSKNAGRSGTVQIANGTEVAFYPRNSERDPALGFLNSFYDQGEMSLGVFDSTANGPFGLFYDLWMDKSNSWEKVFAAWFEFPEYSKRFTCIDESVEFEKSLSDEERELRLRYDLTLEQLHWRRMTIKDKCQGEPDKFKQEYPSNDVEAFLKAARLRFNATVVESLKKITTYSTGLRGEIMLSGDRAGFTPDDAGSVTVWEQPKIGNRYLVSIDTCTGEDQQQSGVKSNPDYHSIGVWRAGYVDSYGREYAPRLAAHHYSRIDADLAAKLAAYLSRYYGGCILVPEVNNSGLLVVKRLLEYECDVYQRTTVNKLANMEEKHFGWRTDAMTRKSIIDNLAQVLREWKADRPTVEIECPWIVAQLGKFIVNENGRAEAMPGEHDDGVLQSAIALYNMSLATEYKAIRRSIKAVRENLRRQGWRTV